MISVYRMYFVCCISCTLLLLICTLSLAAQCIVIRPVCLYVCVFVCLFVCGSVTTITRNCVHRSSPNWSQWLQLIKFWPFCAPGKGVCGGAKIFDSALLQPARSVCVLFHRCCCRCCWVFLDATVDCFINNLSPLCSIFDGSQQLHTQYICYSKVVKSVK